MSRKTTTIWAVGAVVIAGAGIIVAAVAANSPHAESAGPSTTATPNSIATATATASPSATPTPTDSAEPGAATTTGPATGATAAPAPGSSSAPSPLTSVTPVITFYDGQPGSLTVGAHVAGLVENRGSCVLTATRGAATVTKSFAASAQASSTECGTMTIASTKLVAGDWTVRVSYASSKATGSSTTATVTL